MKKAAAEIDALHKDKSLARSATRRRSRSGPSSLRDRVPTSPRASRRSRPRMRNCARPATLPTAPTSWRDRCARPSTTRAAAAAAARRREPDADARRGRSRGRAAAVVDVVRGQFGIGFAGPSRAAGVERARRRARRGPCRRGGDRGQACWVGQGDDPRQEGGLTPSTRRRAALLLPSSSPRARSGRTTPADLPAEAAAATTMSYPLMESPAAEPPGLAGSRRPAGAVSLTAESALVKTRCGRTGPRRRTTTSRTDSHLQ